MWFNMHLFSSFCTFRKKVSGLAGCKKVQRRRKLSPITRGKSLLRTKRKLPSCQIPFDFMDNSRRDACSVFLLSLSLSYPSRGVTVRIHTDALEIIMGPDNSVSPSLQIRSRASHFWRRVAPFRIFHHTGSLSQLRTMLPESSSRPLPAKRPNHAT